MRKKALTIILGVILATVWFIPVEYANAAIISCVLDDSGVTTCDALPTVPSNCKVIDLMADEVKMECTGNPSGFNCTNPQNTSAFTCSDTSAPTPTTSTPPATGSGNSNCPPGQLCYVPLEPLPGIDQSGEANFADLISGFFRLLLNIGAFLAVTVLVIGGITYMFSDSGGKKSAAKDRIKAALWGLGILGGAWIILNTINPQLISFNRDFLNPISSSNAQPSTQTSTQSGNCAPPSNSGGSVIVSAFSQYTIDSVCGQQVQSTALGGTVLQNTSSLGAVMVGRNSEISSATAVQTINSFEQQCKVANSTGGHVTRIAIGSNITIFVCVKN